MSTKICSFHAEEILQRKGAPEAVANSVLAQYCSERGETTLEPVRVGVIGCGNISGIYLRNLQTSSRLEVVACADIDMERAYARGNEFGVAACTVEELLADEAIELVVNLTVPKAHAEVALAALEAGKSVYNEKPLAVELADGARILEEAERRGLLVGCAPDTFLGAGLQTCRKLVDDGWIGEPVGATAFMMSPGHEGWHPNPAFYYEVGGGPLFDMGPYYLTALVSIMGPIARVTGSARATFPFRTITSAPRYGERVKVETPTHVTGLMEFATGAIGTIITSFDVWGANLPYLEIYGTEGSLSLPDPNHFKGPVRVRRAHASEWHEIPLTHGYPENSRGLGVVDMAIALREGGAHRASGQLAYHVLDVMHAILRAAEEGRHITVDSTCERPEPMPIHSPRSGSEPWIRV